jgi:hypothetical protein
LPITIAHAAAAWPLHRAAKRLPLAALVIGTFAPDLEYVLRLQPVGKFGHSPVGLVVFCIPATLVVFWGWSTLVRPALTPLLPAGLRAAAEAPPPGRRTDVVPLALVAALLGSATHVFWDGFTHPNGWSVLLFPPLANASPFFALPWYYLLQYASSVVGVLVIALWMLLVLRRFPREARRFAPGQRARLVRVAAFVAAAMAAVGLANAALGTDLAKVLGRGAIGGEIGFALGLVAYGLRARSRTRSDSRS